MTKTKQNRKTKYFKDYLELNNQQLKINAGKDKGIYLEILTRIINQLDTAYSIHKRLLVIFKVFSLPILFSFSHLVP